MSAFRSSVAAAVLGLAACYGEIPTRPFRLSASIAATGADARPSPDYEGLQRLTGTGQLEGPTSLLVADASLGTVRFSFDEAAAPGVAIPAVFDGAEVLVLLQWNLESTDPHGDPLPLVAARIFFAGRGSPDALRFVIAEGSLRTGSGVAEVPALAEPVLGESDLPYYELAPTGLSFVATRCGEVYPDHLMVIGPDRTVFLSEGQEGLIPVGTLGAPTWVVHHVTSWHRAGREGSCREPGAWTQFAAWR